MTMEKPRKTLTLGMTGYIVKGVSDVEMWGGGNGCIEMDGFRVRGKIEEKTLLESINDGGFGVQKINGAICDIYEDYEGTLVFAKTITVGKVSEHTWNFYEEHY